MGQYAGINYLTHWGVPTCFTLPHPTASFLCGCPDEVGKQNTQKIENKHLILRMRIKLLTRKTICFSKTVFMHDLVIGLFINRYEFGLSI